MINFLRKQNVKYLTRFLFICLSIIHSCIIFVLIIASNRYFNVDIYVTTLLSKSISEKKYMKYPLIFKDNPVDKILRLFSLNTLKLLYSNIHYCYGELDICPNLISLLMIFSPLGSFSIYYKIFICSNFILYFAFFFSFFNFSIFPFYLHLEIHMPF